MVSRFQPQFPGGIIPALPTPLTDQGQVDEEGLSRLVRYVLGQGVHGLWSLGSSGEFAAFAPEERELIIEVTVEAAQGRVPVIAGVADNSVKQLIRNAEAAAVAGASACFFLLPHYFACDPREAVLFLREAAAAAPLPVVLYDNPASTRLRLDPASYLQVAGHPNLVGLKDSSCDLAHFQRLILELKGRTTWKILQGDERLAACSFLWGADGAVAALASVTPRLFVTLYEAAQRRDLEGCLQAQREILPLCRLFELEGSATDGAFFAGLKASLEVLGICGRAVSPPFQRLPAERMACVEQLLRECRVPLSA